MAVISVRDIMTSYRDIKYSPLLRLRGDMPDECYNFENVKIDLKDESLVMLDNISFTGQQEPTQKKKITKKFVRGSKTKVVFEKTNARSPPALAMLRATDESIGRGRILLQTGVITGLNRSLITIPLEEVGFQQFGRSIQLDLSKPVCYDKTFEQPAPNFDEKNISKESSAHVYCTVEKSKGFFQCEVIMEGIVAIRDDGGTYGIEIAKAVAELDKKGYESVQGLRSDRKTVEFTVKGEMDFRRPGIPEIEWQ